MSGSGERPSPRRDELLERAYRYVLDHGLSGLSLRPLAAATGTSAGVLLFLFGSKDGLVRALLARARDDELTLLRDQPAPGDAADLAAAVETTWAWLSAPAHRPVLTLWLEAFARSLAEPEGPWAHVARQTVEDWLRLLGGDALPAPERTLALAVLRGAMLDLLATGDAERTGEAVRLHLDRLGAAAPRRGQEPGAVDPPTVVTG